MERKEKEETLQEQRETFIHPIQPLHLLAELWLPMDFGGFAGLGGACTGIQHGGLQWQIVAVVRQLTL